jgi:signal transduction histidine kinase/DNA-binding response OmpR family regulator/streptogramin lyase
MRFFSLAHIPLAVIIFTVVRLACLPQPQAHAQHAGLVSPTSNRTERHLSLHQPDIAVTFDRFWVVTGPREIHRRQDGMLWVVAGSGLYRHDGYELRDFHEPLEKPESRMASYFSCGAEDESGNLWLGAQYGFQRFDDCTGGFERFTNVPDQPTTISNNIILSVCPDGKGSVWVGTLHGLNRFDRATRTFQRFVKAPGDVNSLLCDTVLHVKVDRDGRVWAGSLQGLSVYDPTTKRFTSYTTSSPPPFRLPSNVIRCLYPGKDGLLWFATVRGISAFDITRGTSRFFPFSPSDPSGLRDSIVTCMGEDDLGNFWIGTESHGLVRLDPDKALFTYYLDAPAAGSISPLSRWNVAVAQMRSVNCISPDRQSSGKQPGSPSILWVVADAAIWRVAVSRQQFAILSPRAFEPGQRQILRPIVPTGGRYFWTTVPFGEVVQIDLQTMRMKAFPVTERPKGDLLVTSAAMTPDGTSWLVLWPRLYIFNARKGAVDLIAGVDTATHVCAGRDGSLWFTTLSPGKRLPVLARLDPGTGLVTRYDRDTLPGEGIFVTGVRSMVQDKNGEVWFGTFGQGLFRFNPQTRLYRRYSSAPGETGALKMTVIRALLMDSTGTIWIGTDSGLHRYIRETDSFERFAATGQESNEQGHFIRGLTLDQQGNIWLAHSSGISRFDPRLARFRDLTEVDGLKRTQYVQAVFEPVGKTMFVTDMTGSILAFRPENIPSSSTSGKVILTDFRIFEKTISLPEPINRMREVNLSYDQNFFSFRFSALEFLRVHKINYAYRMEGFDRDWIQAGTRAYAGYTNLDYGRYLFKVKATDVDGVWSDSVTTISVVVHPPWWKTPWAYGLWTFAVVSLLFGAWHYDRRRVRMRHELEMKGFEARKLLEVDQLKTRFFANISHECRTPLTLILGPAQKLSSQTTDPDDQRELHTIERNAHSLLGLINQLLDLSKLDAGHMVLQVQSMNLAQLLQRIVASFSSLADRKKVTLVFDSHEHELITYVDQEKLEKIVTNLLSNAFKFTGPGGEIIVTLRRRNEAGKPDTRWAEISVSDTGTGIPQDKLEKIFERFYQVDSSSTRAHSGTGIGLSLTKELVELHRGHIHVTSKEGEGSTFFVCLPLGKEKYTPDEIVEAAAAGEVVDNRPQYAVAEETEEPVQRPEASSGPPSAPLVLIVEDNADLRRYIREYLEDSYNVAEANDGIQGMERAFSSIPDLIITDIMMPRMDGLELCRRLKNDERTSHIPVILLTARASGESKLEGFETGADDYVIKPFDAKELLARVHNLIEIRQVLRKKFREKIFLEPGDIPLSSADASFLKKLMDAIEQHMADPDCDTETLAREMRMSRMQLNRKLQALSGQSTHEFLKIQRLKRAEQLLRHRRGNISEIGYEVGFASPSHFGQAFKEQFGMSPSEYAVKRSNDPGAN